MSKSLKTKGLENTPPQIIQEVYADNLDVEMKKIYKLIEKYPYVSMVINFYINILGYRISWNSISNQ